MLIPLVGLSGSGKTTYMIEQMKELVQQGEKVLFLVPEQFSFAAEQKITQAMGPRLAMNVEVYSFTRLCHKVFSRYGGIAGQYVTEPAKRILMALALNQVRDQLVVYSKAAASSSFVESILDVVEEFKNAGVEPDQLLEFSQGEASKSIIQKIEEIYEIYKIYQSLLEKSFWDEKDSLVRARRILEGESFFSTYYIFVDGFMAFMAAEHKMLELMIKQCKGIILAMPTNSLELQGKKGETGMLNTVKETALQVISAARRNQVPVAAPVVLQGNNHFAEESLSFLQQNILKTKKEKFLHTNNGVFVFEAVHPYEEIRFVAAQIIQLVKGGEFRFKDIAIIARSLQNYETSLETLSQQYGIPLFWDRRKDIMTIPVTAFVTEALEAVRSNFETEHVLAVGKNPLAGLPYVHVLNLENYCYLWSIKRRQWLEPFQNNPRGLVEGFTEKDLAQLEQINQTAAAVVHPLCQLKERIEHCTGKEFAQAVYAYLEQTNIRQNIQQFQKEGEEGLLYQEYLQTNEEAWNVLMDLLDTIYHVLGDVPLPLDTMVDLFIMGLRCSDFGEIPNTLDQVVVGTADRMRPDKPKVTFVIGLNQGEFPPQLKENGVFSDAEREELAQNGIKINPTVLKRGFYEEFYLYSALTSPSQRLYLCCHKGLLNGELTPPSVVVEQVLEMFGPQARYNPIKTNPLFYAANQQTAFELLCSLYQVDSVLTSSLKEYIQGTSQGQALGYLEEVLEKKEFRIKKREVSQLLFGNTMRLSPSRVENYFTCPFSYFCSAGLGLRARKKVEFSPLQSGTVIHYVLEKMVSRHQGKGLGQLNPAQMQEEVSRVLQEYLESRVEQKELLTKRFQYLLGHLTDLLTRLLLQIGRELSQSEFVPYGFELPIAPNSQAEPLVCQTADGRKILVEGIVDRVDVMEKDGQRYARVVDYKSGSKEFKLSDVYYGLNLQMLIYLFSIWKNGTGNLENTLPGGVLYLQARDYVISAQRNTPKEQIEKERMKKYKMNGLVLHDPACISGMEKDIEGVYIPVKTKLDGSFDSTSSLATLSQMGQIQRHIEQLLQNMAENLYNGHIEARPVKGSSYEPCKYCDYKSICQHQKDDRFRVMDAISRKEFFEKLEEEEQ